MKLAERLLRSGAGNDVLPRRRSLARAPMGGGIVLSYGCGNAGTNGSARLHLGVKVRPQRSRD